MSLSVNDQIFPFMELYQDLQLEVLTYLDPRTLKESSTVSKGWYRLFHSPIECLHYKILPILLGSFTLHTKDFDELENVKISISKSNKSGCWIESFMDPETITENKIAFLVNNIWFVSYSFSTLRKLNEKINNPLFSEVLKTAGKKIDYTPGNLKQLFHLDQMPSIIRSEALRVGYALLCDIPRDKRDQAVYVEGVDHWNFDEIPEEYRNQDLYVAYVKQGGNNNLERVPVAERSPRVCLAAVLANSWDLIHVPIDKRTDEMYKSALSKSGNLLSELSEEEKTEERCFLASKASPFGIEYTPKHLQKKVSEMLKTAGVKW